MAGHGMQKRDVGAEAHLQITNWSHGDDISISHEGVHTVTVRGEPQ
jgi:hypothetical protein